MRESIITQILCNLAGFGFGFEEPEDMHDLLIVETVSPLFDCLSVG